MMGLSKKRLEGDDKSTLIITFAVAAGRFVAATVDVGEESPGNAEHHTS